MRSVVLYCVSLGTLSFVGTSFHCDALNTLFGGSLSPLNKKLTAAVNNPPGLAKKSIFPSSRTPRDLRVVQDIEDQLLQAIADQGNRLANNNSDHKKNQISALIAQLESTSLAVSSSSSSSSSSDSSSAYSYSIPNPAIAEQVYGRWKLVYSTNADTSSPIQKSAVNAQTLPIYQDIIIVDTESPQAQQPILRVNQVVQFSDTAELVVSARACTAAYPYHDPRLAGDKELELEFTSRPRQSSGRVFGLNVLGVSLVGNAARPDPNRPNSRIDFVFDEGNFRFFKQQNNKKKKQSSTTDTSTNINDPDPAEVFFTIPYPVPFRWPVFRDLVKGWIDITFLSERMRICRGNKGTTFVLVKQQPKI